MSEQLQITFKIEAGLYQQLREEAERSGTSPNLAARDYVTRGLKGENSLIASMASQLSKMRETIEQLIAQLALLHSVDSDSSPTPDDSVRHLRIDLATVAAAILAELRPHEGPESIAAWVKKNLVGGGLGK